MSATLKFKRGGLVQAVWDDRLADFFLRAFGPDFASARRRASIINTIESGVHAGKFYADMSYLAELTGNPAHNVCLLAVSSLETDVKQAEVAYIEEHFLGK